MKLDAHFHVVGRGKDIGRVDENVFFCPEDNNTFFTRMLYKLVEEELKKLEADSDRSGTDRYG